MSERDRETRDRLLNAAAELFAARGFRKVTVREICRTARANVAAVNYHFGDKMGLYREVLQSAIDSMRSTNEAARQAGKGKSPEERLRRYIHVYLRRVIGGGRTTWIHRLITREIADPTPALDAIVEQGLRPRFEYLSALVAAILRCSPSDERVLHCVASIQVQWTIYLPNPIGSRLARGFTLRADQVDAVADHIATFSLAGIRGIQRSSRRASRQTAKLRAATR